MASNGSIPHIAIPQPAIFQSDPMEQIALKGVMEGKTPGLDYMFMNAAQDRRNIDQDQYMQGVREANKMSAALVQQELMSKNAMGTLAEAVKMATGVGTPTDTMPIMRLLMPSGVNDPGAAAKLALLQSEANANNAKAANAGADKTTVEMDTSPVGPTTGRIVSTGRNPSTLLQNVLAQAIADQKNRAQHFSQTGANPQGIDWNERSRQAYPPGGRPQ